MLTSRITTVQVVHCVGGLKDSQLLRCGLNLTAGHSQATHSKLLLRAHAGQLSLLPSAGGETG